MTLPNNGTISMKRHVRNRIPSPQEILDAKAEYKAKGGVIKRLEVASEALAQEIRVPREKPVPAGFFAATEN